MIIPRRPRSRGLEFARSYKGKFLSISSIQEASKDREFVTPFDIKSLNRGPNRPVVGRHSITSLAGYSAGLATLSASSCLCAQTGETFCRKVASAGKPVDGHQGGRSPVRGSVCPEATPQAGKARPWVSVTHARGMQSGKPGCGGCGKE